MDVLAFKCQKKKILIYYYVVDVPSITFIVMSVCKSFYGKIVMYIQFFFVFVLCLKVEIQIYKTYIIKLSTLIFFLLPYVEGILVLCLMVDTGQPIAQPIGKAH